MEPQVTVADAIKMVGDIRKMFEEKIPQIDKAARTEEELRTEFDKRFKELTGAIEELKRQQLPPVNPLNVDTDRYLSQRGGIFARRHTMPYRRLMEVSPLHPAVRQADRDQLTELQDLNDLVVWRYWAIVKQGGTTDPGERFNALSKTPEFQDYFRAMVAAGFTRANEVIHPGSSGIGANLNFTLLSAQLFDRVRLALATMGRFTTIPLPRANTDFPTLTGDSMGVLGGFGGSPTVDIPRVNYAADMVVPPAAALSNPTFGIVNFRARHFLGFILWNDDMFEDSVVPWLPIMRDQVGRTIARATEDCFYNGVRTGVTHLDADVTAAQDRRNGFHGIRKLCNTTKITASGAALSVSLLRDLRASLGKYGMNPDECFWAIHNGGWYKVLRDNDVRTMDVFGSEATVKRGVIAKLDGIDLVLSEHIRTDLNASGVQDGVTTTRTMAACVNQTRFLHGIFGGVQVEETRWATALSTIIQADVRQDFKPIEATTAASNTEFAAGPDLPANILYNVLT